MLINIHTHCPSFAENTEEIVNLYPNTIDFENLPKRFSIGIHPWYANVNTLNLDLEILKQAILYPNCFAIGECGLDRLCDTSFDFQEIVFIKQLELSLEYKKPLIVHCVKAFAEIEAICKSFCAAIPIIIHGFNKLEALAKHLIGLGFYLSLGKPFLASKSYIGNLDSSKLFLETDSSSSDINEIYALANLDFTIFEANFNTILHHDITRH